MPYFPMFAADWLLSQTVATMAPEEQGIYISLLAHAWMNDGIPADHRKLLRLLGIDPATYGEALSRVIDAAWKPDSDNPRILRNDRQEAIRQEVDATYRASVERMARARAANPKNNPQINRQINPLVNHQGERQRQRQSTTSPTEKMVPATFSASRQKLNEMIATEAPVFAEDFAAAFRASHSPDALEASIRATYEGMNGPGGKAVPLAILGQVLRDCAQKSIIPTARVLCGFSEALMRPSKAGPKASGEELFRRLEEGAR
jgi:uncharacterized protein YdaU (DUF1376 family)